MNNIGLAEVLDWLNERMAYALRLAELKTGADREGWLEDAIYFQAALDLLSVTQDLSTITQGDCPQ